MTSLDDEVVERVPPNAWVPSEGTSDGLNEVSQWCPVIEFGEPLLALGFSLGGEWFWGDAAGTATTVYPLEGPSLVGVLPILEVPLPMVRSEAGRAATRLGLRQEALVEALPITEILRAALTTRSEYWVDLALAWMDAGAAVDDLADHIVGAATDTRLAQRTRQRLQRVPQ